MAQCIVCGRPATTQVTVTEFRYDPTERAVRFDERAEEKGKKKEKVAA